MRRFGINKIHQYNEMMRWLTRPKEDPSIKQLAVFTNPQFGTQDTYGAPEEIPMPNWRDLIREEGVQVGPQVKAPVYNTRKYFKPGGLVEPGVTHYAKTNEEIAAEKKNIRTWEKTFNKKIEDQSLAQQYRIKKRGAEMYPPGKDPASHVHQTPKYLEDPSYLYDREKLLKKIKDTKGTFKELENTPEFKRYIKENKIDYSIGDMKQAKKRANIRRNFAKSFLREGTIGLKELAKHTPYEHGTLMEMFFYKDYKITKNTPVDRKNKINNAKRMFAELEKILPPLSAKEWYSGAEGAKGAGYRFLKPNKNQIKKLQEFALRDSFFHSKTIDNMNTLFKNKKLMNAFEQFDGETVPKYIMDTVFKEGAPSDKMYALRTLARVMQGKGELEGIPKNKILGNKIAAAMFYDASRKGRGSSVWTESYRYARQEMSKYAGKGFTFDDLANNIKADFKELNKSLPKNSKITKIAIDEVFPIRTGIYELKGADAYSNFVQFIDNEINSSEKVRFDGQSTQRAKKIIAELKKSKPDYELVKTLSQTQDAEIQKFYKKNPGTRGKVNLQRFRWDEVNKRFMNPKEIFETQYKGRYAELPSKIRTGMEKFYSKTGLSIDPGKTFTMLEAQKRPNIEKMLAKAGFNFDHCKLKSVGGSYNTCVRDTIEAEQKKALDGNAKSKTKFGKVGKLASKAGWVVGWIDAPIELAFALPHMLRGDVNAAKRATTLGLAGWGSDKELGILQEANPVAYRSAKRKRDMDNYIDNWFRSEIDKQTLETAPEEFKSDLKQNITTSLTNMENIAKNFPAPESPEAQYQEDKALRNYIRTTAEERARAGLTLAPELFGGIIFAPGAEGQKLDTLEKHIKYKGEPYWKNIEPMLEDLNYPFALHPYEVKDYRDRYSELPIKLASELGPLEAKETRTALEELESRNIPFYNQGGRVGFKLGGIDKGRRAFMKWLAGITGAGVAGATGLLKWGKIGGKGTTAIKAGDHIIQGTQGMPDWYIPLINRIVKEGDDVTTKLGTKEREIVHTKKIGEGEEVTVYQDLDTGNVRVDYDSPYNMGEGIGPVSLEYKAPQVIDEGKHAGKKTNPEFEAYEPEPVGYTHGPDDYAIEWDGANVVGRAEDLISDTSKLKQFATKKKPTMKEIVTRKKKRDQVDAIHKDESDYIATKQGEGEWDDYLPDIDDMDY